LMGYILDVGEAPPATASTPAPAGQPAVAGRPLAEMASIATGGDIRATPIARRLATEHRIDLASVRGSGPGGRIVEADVLAMVAARGAIESASPTRPERRIREKIPFVGVRRTIADRLRGSQSTVASVTLTREVDADRFVKARDQLGTRIGLAIPYDALFVKVLAQALRDFPALNATIEG